MSRMAFLVLSITRFLLLLFFAFKPFLVKSESKNTEQTILLNLKRQWGNPPGLRSWNSSSSPCDWPEIRCTNGTVTEIRLQYKGIDKEVPPAICDLQNLSTLSLSDNLIYGGFPTILSNCSKLEYLDLSNNLLAGAIPDDIHRMSGLLNLNLGGNQFTDIPAAIGQLSKLQSLFLNWNEFSCSIPREIGNLTNLEELDMSYNYMFKPSHIPPEFRSLRKLTHLTISDSNVIGKIPVALSELLSIEILELSMNRLNGSVPSWLFQMKNLYCLDLRDNRLSGDVPTPAEDSKLVTIDLSQNCLTPRVPKDFQKLRHLQTFTHYNSDSCAQKTPPNVISKIRIIILTTAVFLVGLIGLSIFMYAKRPRRRKQRETQVAGWNLICFQRLDFTEWDILSSLTESNLIGFGGSGRVYRVVIDTSGVTLAVKSVWNVRKLHEKVEKQFLAEVQILGTIRHSNIVKLLCCISGDNSKLLVYEYMENLSLDRWLHRKNGSISGSVQDRVLDWPTRLQVAIGAARGLCYMHHDCSPPIIHRDIKSSNILLDSEFNARIADFGLAKMAMVAKQGDPETASAVAGTFGYIAPEYAYTAKVNVKSDIYSFGVVLLELATGREPINVDEHINLAEWAWRHHEEGKSIVDALAEEIREEACYLEQMSVMFKLGLMCTGPSPSTRPSMKEVLQILQYYANKLCC